MKLVKRLLIPLLVLTAGTLLLEAVDADIRTSSLFYDPGKGGWFLDSANPWTFLYDHAHKPAYLLGTAAAAVFLAGWIHRGLTTFRKESLFLLLFLAIGPGLVIDSGFKNHWGRPRPKEIVQFGGEAAYRPFWKFGTGERNSSFPSGHASMGFYLIAPYFFLRRRNNRLAFYILGGGLAAGCLFGAARIIQGKHFLSDVIWSGGMIYLTGEILAVLFHFDNAKIAKTDANDECVQKP